MAFFIIYIIYDLERNANGWFFWAGVEDGFDGGFFGGGNPESVLVFNGDLAGDVLTAKSFVGRKPRSGVAIGLALVGLGVYGEEIERVRG